MHVRARGRTGTVEEKGVGVEVEEKVGGRGCKVERVKEREGGGREVRWERKGVSHEGAVVGEGCRL